LSVGLRSERTQSDRQDCTDHHTKDKPKYTVSGNVALDAVISAVVAVPEHRVVAAAADLELYRKLHRVADDAEVVRESDGEAELVRGAVARAVHVAGLHVGERQPAVHRVPDADALLEGNVGDAHDAVDAAGRHEARLERDAPLQHALGEVPRHARLREAGVQQPAPVRREVGALAAQDQVLDGRRRHDRRLTRVHYVLHRLQVQSERVGETHLLLAARRRQRRGFAGLEGRAASWNGDGIELIILLFITELTCRGSALLICTDN